jgi:putative ABC transport system ATP-binding protein
MAVSPILCLESVSLIKGGRTVLHALDASVAPGEILIIQGASGAGKTSLLRLLNRMEEPGSGRILFKNQDVKNYPPTELRRKIALVFQTPVFFPGSVLENLKLVDRLNHRPCPAESIYRDKLHWVGLPGEKLMQDAASLSLGEKQRLAVARALLNEPDILLLDEPTSALDPESSQYLLDAVHELHHDFDMTIIMVTHQAAHGSRIGSRQWTMEAGRVIRDEALLHHPAPALPREGDSGR